MSGETFIGEFPFEGAVELGGFASQPAVIEPVKLLLEGLLDSAAAAGKLALGDGAIQTREELLLDGERYLAYGHMSANDTLRRDRLGNLSYRGAPISPSWKRMGL